MFGIITLTFAASALALALWAFVEAHKSTHKSFQLQEALARTQELEEVVVTLADLEGQVRAKVALPALPEEHAQLQQQKAALEDAARQMKAMRAELKEAKDAQQEAEKTLAEVLDPQGEVLHKIRLPGKRVYPDRTPCGSLCKRAFWHDHTWRCRAYQGYRCATARARFLDAEQQCVMFERNK